MEHIPNSEMLEAVVHALLDVHPEAVSNKDQVPAETPSHALSRVSALAHWKTVADLLTRNLL